jgi:hypothetical protein
MMALLHRIDDLDPFLFPQVVVELADTVQVASTQITKRRIRLR